MSKLILALIFLALGGRATGNAEMSRISVVQRSRLTIDAGAASGLGLGVEVVLLRPGEEVIHPRTGENLGAPQIEIGKGTVVKIADQQAVVEVKGRLLMVVQPGDLARFPSDPGGEVVPEAEQPIEPQLPVPEGAAPLRQEHQAVREELAKLTHGVTDIQRRIGSLEHLMKRVERVEEGFRVQLRGINQDLTAMKRDIKTLQAQMALYEAIPVSSAGERSGAMDEPGLTREDVEELILKLVGDRQTTTTRPRGNGLELAPLPDDGDPFLEAGRRSPFYTRIWFFGMAGAALIIGVAALIYLKMNQVEAAADEEVEKDEELEEREPEIEIEVEDEDDIVVEETS